MMNRPSDQNSTATSVASPLTSVGGVIWITGYSSSGKTTVGRKVVSLLRNAGLATVFLDGDDLRGIFGNKWGYAKEDREELARVYFRMCSHLASQGIIVVISAVAMYKSIFEWFSRTIPNAQLVYLKVPEAERVSRDKVTKQLYTGSFKTAPEYDEPQDAALTIGNFGSMTVGAAATMIVEHFRTKSKKNEADRGKGEHWESYYSDHGTVPAPSSFAKFVVENYLTKPTSILEVGCGNGRDAVFLADAGHLILGIDASDAAIKLCTNRHRRRSLRFSRCTADELVAQPEVGTFAAIYSRFVLHAMTPQEEALFLESAEALLIEGGLLLIECRSVNDPMIRKGEVLSPTERISGHYRRFIDRDELEENLKRRGFKIEFALESRGLAQNETEDPVVIRIIARREVRATVQA